MRLYSTQWGPMLILPPLALWTETNAYTLHGINTDNLRGLAQYREMGSASSMDVLIQNRHHSCELGIDGVRTLCAEEGNDVDLGGGVIVDVSEACAILGAWDATSDADRVGPHIWREFWNRVRDTPNLWAVPFDASDPVHTPRDLNRGDPAVRAQAMADLASAVQRLADEGIPPSRPRGEVQFDTRADGSMVPIHGGDGGSGDTGPALAAGGPLGLRLCAAAVPHDTRSGRCPR